MQMKYQDNQPKVFYWGSCIGCLNGSYAPAQPPIRNKHENILDIISL